MGGKGSGRKSSRTKADTCPNLDVLRLWKAGQLEVGVSSILKYRQRGGDVLRIGHLASETHLLLVYPRLLPNEERKVVEIPAPLTWSPLPYGGARPYFRCPASSYGRICKRRVAKLYLKGGIFLCRHCHKLTYHSQSETRIDRLNRRADKIRKALTRDGLPPEWFPARPKGMWQRTYEAKIEEIFILEGAVETAAGDWLEERYGTRNLRDLFKESN